MESELAGDAAAAVAEAQAAVTAPDFDAAAAEARGVDVPAPGPAAPPPPEQPQVEGQTAQPATPAEPDGDYDEESFALYPEGEAPDQPSQVAPQAAPKDPLEAKVAALVEAQLKARTTAPPAQPVQVDEREAKETILKTLAETDGEVHGLIGRLESARVRVAQHHETLQSKRTEKAGLESKITKLDAVVEFLEGQVTADPEDHEARERLIKSRTERDTLDRQLYRAEREEAGLEREAETLQRQHAETRRQILSRVDSEYARTQEEAQTRDRQKADHDKAIKDWGVAFPAFAKKHGIDKPLLKGLNKALLHQAAAHPGDIENIAAWMDQQTWVIDWLKEHERAITARYGDEKRADAVQPGPKGPAAVVPVQKGGERMTAEEMSRLTAKQITQELARR